MLYLLKIVESYIDRFPASVRAGVLERGVYDNLINKLSVTEKNVVRVMLFRNHRDHTAHLFNNFHILPISKTCCHTPHNDV